MSNTLLNGNDVITQDNMNVVKDYLNNNYSSVEVEFESTDGEVFMIVDGKKYQLYENTTVGDLVSSFDQMYGDGSQSGLSGSVDNDTYYKRNRRNRRQVQAYRIDIDEEAYSSLSSELSSIASSIASSSTYDASMLTDKLGTYYSGLGVDNNRDIENIKNIVEDLGLKIDYSIELYNNTDDQLKYFFNDMVNQVFAYDDFKNNGSVEYLSVEQRKENISNYISYLVETYDAVYNEYLRLYGNGINEDGVLLDRDAGELLYGLMRSFNLNDRIDCYGTTEDGHSYFSIDLLAETVSFIKENDVLTKLTRYTNGESWEDSGMAELNYYVLGFRDTGYMDRHRENEAYFLSTFLENQDQNFIDDIREKYNYQSVNDIFYGENNAEAIVFLKDRMKKQMSSLNLSETEELIENRSVLENTVTSLANQVYNLRQYEKMMPYEEIKKDPEFLKYLGKQYDASGEWSWYDQTELAVYHYVYEKDGFDAANDYLKAMTDAVNQRKGFVAAARYVELLNGGHKLADIAQELSPIIGLPIEATVVAINTLISGGDGFVSGLFTFGKGFYNLRADGVRDVTDYLMMFKASLMQEKNEYNENMSDWERELYYHNNQIMCSVGNMAIPCLLSALGAPELSKVALFLSAMGNATENTRQQGFSLEQSYLFGALSAGLELFTESVMGSLPGIGKNAPSNLTSLKGFQFFKALGISMFKEGEEEFVQAYAEAGLRYMILGEPFDLGETTEEAIQAFIYGAISSGIMNLGTTIPVRLRNGQVVNLTVEELKNFKDTSKVDINLDTMNDVNDTAIPSEYSAATDQSVTDMESIIDTVMKKHNISRDAAIARLETALNTGNYNYITRENGARATFSKYGFSELTDTIKYLKSTDYLLQAPTTTPITTPVAPRTKANDLFNRLKSKYGVTYGVDQGGILGLCVYEDAQGNRYTYRDAMKIRANDRQNGRPLTRFKKIGSADYQKVRTYFETRYNMSHNDASVFLSSVDDVGACSYASTANEIFTSYLGHEDLFQRNFGFSMFDEVTGKPNYEMLLADIYFNVNQVSNGGNLIVTDSDGNNHLNALALYANKTDPLGRPLLNAENQQYLSGSNGKNVDVINRYLASRGTRYESYIASSYSESGTNIDFVELANGIKTEMSNGDCFSLGIYSAGDTIRMIPTESGVRQVTTSNWSEGGGHSICVTDVNDQGFVVSSWGHEFIIPFSDLKLSNATWVLTQNRVRIR